MLPYAQPCAQTVLPANLDNFKAPQTDGARLQSKTGSIQNFFIFASQP